MGEGAEGFQVRTLLAEWQRIEANQLVLIHEGASKIERAPWPG